jgi:hypothetical protein
MNTTDVRTYDKIDVRLLYNDADYLDSDLSEPEDEYVYVRGPRNKSLKKKDIRGTGARFTYVKTKRSTKKFKRLRKRRRELRGKQPYIPIAKSITYRRSMDLRDFYYNYEIHPMGEEIDYPNTTQNITLAEFRGNHEITRDNVLTGGKKIDELEFQEIMRLPEVESVPHDEPFGACNFSTNYITDNLTKYLQDIVMKSPCTAAETFMWYLSISTLNAYTSS